MVRSSTSCKRLTAHSLHGPAPPERVLRGRDSLAAAGECAERRIFCSLSHLGRTRPSCWEPSQQLSFLQDSTPSWAHTLGGLSLTSSLHLRLLVVSLRGHRRWRRRQGPSGAWWWGRWRWRWWREWAGRGSWQTRGRRRW